VSKSADSLPQTYHNHPGLFIVFEGVEGSGKTTQLQLTCDWLKSFLKNREILLTRQPGGTELGVQLRQLLLHGDNMHSRTELLLYAADRSNHVEQFLKPKLAQGAIILCDRYTDSTIAYQSYGRGLNLELINQLNYIATNGLQSDLTLWLDLDVKLGLQRTKKRGKSDRIEQENLDFHLQVQTGYTELAQLYPERIIKIDAHPAPEIVQQNIKENLSKRLFH
jgi:dTMP kinase